MQSISRLGWILFPHVGSRMEITIVWRVSCFLNVCFFFNAFGICIYIYHSEYASHDLQCAGILSVGSVFKSVPDF